MQGALDVVDGWIYIYLQVIVIHFSSFLVSRYVLCFYFSLFVGIV